MYYYLFSVYIHGLFLQYNLLVLFVTVFSLRNLLIENQLKVTIDLSDVKPGPLERSDPDEEVFLRYRDCHTGQPEGYKA